MCTHKLTPTGVFDLSRAKQLQKTEETFDAVNPQLVHSKKVTYGKHGGMYV